ncbi:hypothetical protein Pst134EB_018437 [Puccinia striiformis f. sp. tritici]|nr:hypothetical protein Pst134EB_018437 [Puccinia striiformis f. sp. tritici]
MASLSDIQAMFSAALAQHEEKLEAKLVARDDVIEKLMERVNLQDASLKTGKKKADGQKDALYAHIKIIWNLLEQKTIPSPPHPDTLTEFNGRFSDPSEIVLAADDAQSPSLIPVKEIVSLKSLKLGRRKIGQGIVHLEEFFVEYTQATLARLGLRVWAPDLDDSPHSLYNEACRQAALKTSVRQF